MKALVTGGAGFIGSNLVEFLTRHGAEVTVLDNLSTGYLKNLEGLEVEFVNGDIRDKEITTLVSRGKDTIFHLAASVGRQKSLDNPYEDSDVNVLGTLNLLEGARKASIQRFVYSSSAAIFGELKTPPIVEDHPLNPDSPYGVSKLGGEKHVLCYADLYGMVGVCLRYFNVFGIHQRFDAYGNVIPIFANRLFNSEPITIYGDGEQTRDFVNVRDVVQANYLAATVAKKSGVVNVGCGDSITINQLAQMMMDLSGNVVPIQYSPTRPADVRHCRADIQKARIELGFNPNSEFLVGLIEYWNWFVEDMRLRSNNIL